METKIKLDLIKWEFSHYYRGHRNGNNRVIINEKDKVLFGYVFNN